MYDNPTLLTKAKNSKSIYMYDKPGTTYGVNVLNQYPPDEVIDMSSIICHINHWRNVSIK
jgi:hypothetical protein